MAELNLPRVRPGQTKARECFYMLAEDDPALSVSLCVLVKLIDS